MTTIQDLIQETEKEKEKIEFKILFYKKRYREYRFKEYITLKIKEEIKLKYITKQLSALKQCQTIAEESEKEILKDILVRIDKLLKVRIGELKVAKENDYRSSNIIYNAQVEELQRIKAVIENNYKQQLNPAQTKDDKI